MNLGIRARILVIAVAALLVAAGATSIATSSRFAADHAATLHQRNFEIAHGLRLQLERVLQYGIGLEDLAGFEVQCRETVDAHEPGSRAYVVSPEGRILFHSDPARMGQTLSSPAIVALARSGRQAVAEYAYQGLPLYVAMVPVADRAGRHIASIGIAVPKDVVAGPVRASRTYGLVAGLVAALAGTALLLLALAAFVTRPLGRLLDAVRRLGAEEARVGERVPPVGGAREIRDLGDAFNRLLGRLEAHEAELSRARDAAEAGNEAKSRLLATMSHEIRTPLHGMLGMAALLAQSRLDESQARQVNAVQRAGDQLLRIVDDILDFSRIEAGHLSLEDAPFSPRALLEETVELMGVLARAKGLTIELAVAEAVPAAVRGDVGRVRQVLHNLVANAIKFTTRGAISVRASAAPDGAFVFSVSDTGPGMDAQTLERLYEPFRQGDTSTSRRHGGTGLGLAIVKRIVDAMGGSIEATSLAGLGSEFRVTLPLPVVPEAQLPAPVAPARRAAPAAPARRGAHVLVAEDNPLNQEILCAALGGRGYRVTLAENGREALAAMASHAFDAVLMDCQMPEMDGLEATREWRRREPAGRRLPIIAVTANAIKGDEEQCREAGMDDYLAKPVTPERLVEALERWIDAPVPPAAVLDPGALEVIRAMQPAGGPDLLARALELFRRDAPRLAAEVETAAASADADRLRRAAHTLKSNARSLGARRLEQVCASLEADARAGDPARARRHLPDLKATLEEALAALPAAVEKCP